MSRIDLHIHSTASDGRLSPEEVVRKSAELGMAVIALADHDSVEGIPTALDTARAYLGLMVIPAVEINTDAPEGEIHILGYFIDYTNRELTARLESLRSSREGRAKQMIAKLSKLGVHIDWQRVQEIAVGGAIGRPHLARAMLEKGYITSIKEAFNNYIGRGGPAYVEREKITPAEAVALVVKANGLPVLAHPLTVNDLEAVTTELRSAGLVGVEVYYNGYTSVQISRLVSLADSHNLIATGGSDFHGLDSTETMIGGVEVPPASAERLVMRAGLPALKLNKP